MTIRDALQYVNKRKFNILMARKYLNSRQTRLANFLRVIGKHDNLPGYLCMYSKYILFANWP
jgi:hypothetical protein